MLIQISSGRGPCECEMAVGKYLSVFLEEHPKSCVLEKYYGSYIDCYKSVLLEVDDEEVQTGSVKWICKSPFRKYNKRKNWFIDVSKVDKKKTNNIDEISKSHIKFETFRCGGKGGQNVNKVETGVRAIHIPTGLSVTSTTGRTQAMNKKFAIDRLITILVKKNKQYDELLKEMKWLEHEKIIRGDAFAVYEGMEFKEI